LGDKIVAGKVEVYVFVEEFLADDAAGAFGGEGSGCVDKVDRAASVFGDMAYDFIDPAVGTEAQRVQITRTHIMGVGLQDVAELIIAGRQSKMEQQCRDALTYTLSNEHSNLAEVLNDFIRKPPFTGQLYHERRVAELEKKEQALRAQLTPEALKRIDQQYQLAIASSKADWWVRWKYADFLSEQMRNERGASAQFLWVKNFVPHYAQAWAKLGTSLGKQGNLDAAVAMNSHALELNPAHVFARYNLAFACQMRGQYDTALKHYRLAIQYKPDYPEAYNNIGAILYQQGHVEEAVATYRKALERVQDYADLYYNLGVILEHKGLIDEAIEQYRAALNVEPDSPKLRKAIDIASAKRK